MNGADQASVWQAIAALTIAILGLVAKEAVSWAKTRNGNATVMRLHQRVNDLADETHAVGLKVAVQIQRSEAVESNLVRIDRQQEHIVEKLDRVLDRLYQQKAG